MWFERSQEDIKRVTNPSKKNLINFISCLKKCLTNIFIHKTILIN